MSNLSGRKVSILRLHTTTHIQGLGQLGPAIDRNAAKLLGGLDLTVVDHGILLAAEVKGKTIEHVIPFGNIVGYTLDPAKVEEKAKK